MPPRNSQPALELDVSYSARRPWAPPRAAFALWVRAALAADNWLGACTGADRGSGVRAPNLSVAARRPAVGTAAGPRIQLSVRVIGAARSRALNACYRGRDRPTNVLSFGGTAALPDGQRFLGEILICAPVVAREACAQGKRPQAHWAHLTVHGVLHLLGFDHERGAEALEMESREIQILDRLGISDPYS